MNKASRTKPDVKSVLISELFLDLKNFRTVEQNGEKQAVEAILATSTKFSGLLRSLVKRGYIPRENVIVIQESENKYQVKEGNRRVAALKLLHGLISVDGLDIPNNLAEQINTYTKDELWKGDNNLVPCAIYQPEDIEEVEEIVDQTHAKGQEAGREPWNAVARARRENHKGKSEPAFVLLDKYLKEGYGINLTEHQRLRWGGEYPLTVLEEAMRKISRRLGFANAQELADAYPVVDYREGLEEVIHSIGCKTIGFKHIRNLDPQSDFAAQVGIPTITQSTDGEGVVGDSSSLPEDTKGYEEIDDRALGGSTLGQTQNVPRPGIANNLQKRRKRVAAISDEATVTRLLEELRPNRLGAEKVETLRLEAKRLSLHHTPHAFCFVLRSMLEISAKAYCREESISTQSSPGRDKHLEELLMEVADHLIKPNANTKKDKQMEKDLNSAKCELQKSGSFLSVISLNQLIHHPTFTLTARDIGGAFANIYPLLKHMSEKS